MTPEEKLEWLKKDLEIIIWHCFRNRTTNGNSYMRGYTAGLIDIGTWLKQSLDAKELENQ